MSEIFKIKPLLSEPSTDLLTLLIDRTIFVIALFAVIYMFIKIRESWKTDASQRKSDIVTYIVFLAFVAFLTFDNAKAFTVSSKPSPTLLDIADKISVEGDRVTIEPIKDEYPSYRYNGSLKTTNIIVLTIEEDKEKFKLIDWKSDEYSLSKEEYEMLKAKRHS